MVTCGWSFPKHGFWKHASEKHQFGMRLRLRTWTLDAQIMTASNNTKNTEAFAIIVFLGVSFALLLKAKLFRMKSPFCLARMWLKRLRNHWLSPAKSGLWLFERPGLSNTQINKPISGKPEFCMLERSIFEEQIDHLRTREKGEKPDDGGIWYT